MCESGMVLAQVLEALVVGLAPAAVVMRSDEDHRDVELADSTSGIWRVGQRGRRCRSLGAAGCRLDAARRPPVDVQAPTMIAAVAISDSSLGREAAMVSLLHDGRLEPRPDADMRAHGGALKASNRAGPGPHGRRQGYPPDGRHCGPNSERGSVWVSEVREHPLSNDRPGLTIRVVSARADHLPADVPERERDHRSAAHCGS